MYTYGARITRVVDGDTYDAVVDLGCRIKMEMRIRLHDVDTPETWRPQSEAERAHGEKATEFVKQLIENRDVIIHTYKVGIYNRYECDIIVADRNLRDILIDRNLIKLDNYPKDSE